MIRLPQELFIRELGCDPADFASSAQERDYYAALVKHGVQNDRYLVQDIVNIGGVGVVLRVLDQELRRPLAMKLLLPSRKHATPAIVDFIKEAKIHGWLEHPNIVPLYELGWAPETGLFFTMAYVRGETLKAFLLRVKQRQADALSTYSPYWLLNVFRKVCDAVAYAHALGVLHQDIKPDNIMIGRYGEVFVLDWGTARIVGDPETEPDPVRRQFRRHILEMADSAETPAVARLQGTPSFMSPEQAKGQQARLDERSDIFLLGATLYTMFTLKFPYSGATIKDVLQKARLRLLLPPHLRSPERQIPAEVSRIIMKAMSFAPPDRYQTVAELTRDLDDVLGGRWAQEEIRAFRAGDMLMREGEAGDEAFLVLKGAALVTKQRDETRVVLGVSQRGDIVGEMALISAEPRCATVQALEDMSVTVLTKAMLDYHIRRLPPYIGDILAALTERLQQTDSMVHPHVTSDCTFLVLKQLRLLAQDRFGARVHQVSIPLDELAEEISRDLGISLEKVVNAILSTHYLKLLHVTSDRCIRIPDLSRLTHYTRQVHAPGTRRGEPLPEITTSHAKASSSPGTTP